MTEVICLYKTVYKIKKTNCNIFWTSEKSLKKWSYQIQRWLLLNFLFSIYNNVQNGIPKAFFFNCSKTYKWCCLILVRPQPVIYKHVLLNNFSYIYFLDSLEKFLFRADIALHAIGWEITCFQHTVKEDFKRTKKCPCHIRKTKEISKDFYLNKILY